MTERSTILFSRNRLYHYQRSRPLTVVDEEAFDVDAFVVVLLEFDEVVVPEGGDEEVDGAVVGTAVGPSAAAEGTSTPLQRIIDKLTTRT